MARKLPLQCLAAYVPSNTASKYTSSSLSRPARVFVIGSNNLTRGFFEPSSWSHGLTCLNKLHSRLYVHILHYFLMS